MYQTHPLLHSFSARVWAIITAVAMILSAFPVAFFVAEAATNLYTNSSFTVDNTADFSSGTVDASGQENLNLSFDYDAEELDSGDTLSYGWSEGTTYTELNTIVGSNESGTTTASDEIGTVSVSLPSGAEIATLEIQMSLTANALADVVQITNLLVSGDAVASDYVPSSTNQTNKAAGHGYVELSAATTESVTLNFVNPDNFVMCFEYRTDGDTSEIVSTNGGENYNPAVTSGLYPFLCLTASSSERIIEADSYVEVRSVFGAERDNDFDWTAFTVAEPKSEETIVITGDTSAGENQPGWLFNRDASTASEFEFNTDTASIGDGALYVEPIDGSLNGNSDKFIGEYFPAGGAMPVEDFEAFSYDFEIGAGGNSGDANEFYLNVYTNLTNPTGFYDCRFNFIPASGTVGSFETFSITAATPANTVAARNSASCPTNIGDLPEGSTIRVFAINVGDTSANDSGLDGYYDKVVVELSDKITTFDFEPAEEETLTVSTTKIVCANEGDLPNWGKGENGAPAVITATTATDWLAANPQVDCAIDTEWEFEWADVSVPKPNQYNSYLGSAAGWNTFTGSTKVPVSALNGKSLELREVLPEDGDFLTFGNKNENSPEFYCHDDLLNYDNLERVNKPAADETYHCVAWNVLPNPDPNDENQFNISGEVYLDVAVDDCDNRTECLFSRTDTQLEGWEMRLYKEGVGGWFEVATTTTNSAGIYKFPTQYLSGVYHTCEVLEDGYEQGIGNWNGSGYLVNTANLSGAPDEGPYCNTLTYTDVSDRSSKAHFGNVLSQEPLPVCELTILSDTNTVIESENDYAVATYNSHPSWTADITDATWVWATEEVQNPESDETYTFIETFTVATATEALLDIAADNRYVVYVNGQVALDRSGVPVNYRDHTTKFDVDILEHLIEGENELKIVVTNDAQAGGDYRSNPAGVLYRLDIKGQENCAVTTETEPAPATLEILTPTALENVSGTYDFTAEYIDDDETEDTILWAIRFETCAASTNTVAGNVDGFTDSSSFTSPLFSATLDTTAWDNGEYCFIVNPSEQSGEDDLRATQVFFVENGNDDNEDTGTTTATTTEETLPDPVSTQGSGGGNGGSATLVGFRSLAAPQPLVLGATTSVCPFLVDYMQIGADNDRTQVLYLQIFLNVFKDVFGGTDNPVTGTFGTITDANVKAFQEHYRSEILDPWFEQGIVPHNRPTGFVYKTTLWKINSIICGEDPEFPSLAGEDLTSNVDNDINEPVRD